MIGFPGEPDVSVGEPVSSDAVIINAIPLEGGAAISIDEGAMRNCKQSSMGRKRRGERMENLLREKDAMTE